MRFCTTFGPMNRLYAFLISSLCCISVMHAQTTPWHFGVSTYTNYSAPLYSAEPESEWAVDLWKDVEQPKLSFGANVFVEYSISRRLGLSIGLGYLNYGERTNKHNFDGFTFPDTLDPFYGFVKPTGPIEGGEIKFIYTTHAVEVPVQLRYTFGQNWYVQSGVSLLGQVRYIQTNWKKIEGEKATRETQTDNRVTLNPLNLGVNAGVGYTFFATKPAQLFVGLNAQHVVFGVMQDVSLNRKYISAGIQVGVRF